MDLYEKRDQLSFALLHFDATRRGLCVVLLEFKIAADLSDSFS